jgi:hypothetical protein
MEAVHRVVYEDGPLVAAIAPDGSAVLQLAFDERALRACTEANPPSVVLPAEAATELALELLRQLRPGLVAQLEVAERRAALRALPRGDAA